MNIINVTAHTNSSKNFVIEKENEINVYVTCIPEKGKANKAIIKLLSKHFKKPKSKIKLVKGEKSKTKVFEFYD